MRWTTLLAGVLALSLLPTTALGGHMTQYRYYAVEHDDQGRSDEPDGLATSVFGPTVDNCVVELPTALGWSGACTRPQPAPFAGQAAVLAPGCTGDGPDGPVRAASGQCGLWTVGAGDFTIGSVLPGTVPEPVSERGMAGERAPGAFTPTKSSAIRFLDGNMVQAHIGLAGPHVMVEVNRKVGDLNAATGAGVPAHEAILPGGTQPRWWYGEWRDRNGNGVIDHVTPGSAGPSLNEFAWLSSCMSFGERRHESIMKGLCIEDPNPNADPPGTLCADPASLVACAMTTVHVWIYPGNHHGYSGDLVRGVGDYPGQQFVNWFVFECFEYTSCDEPDVAYAGDPLLGPQDAVTPDSYGGDFGGAREDYVRSWYNGNNWAFWFYGDDGLLVSSVQAYGVNCRPHATLQFDLADCTFRDVDRSTTVSPLAEHLLVGSAEQPDGGLKGQVRSAWLLVRDA